MRNSPKLLDLLLLMNSSTTARAIRGRTITEMSILKPKSAIIHAVNVVPTLAPIITAMDWASDIRPALTKLTTITVDADELWIRAVMRHPVSSPVNRLRVMADRMLRSRSPATFWSPSLITFMPYMNRPTAPSKPRKSKKV